MLLSKLLVFLLEKCTQLTVVCWYCLFSSSIIWHTILLFNNHRNTVTGDPRWCCTFLLDPSDPLFIEIGEAFIKQQIKGLTHSCFYSNVSKLYTSVILDLAFCIILLYYIYTIVFFLTADISCTCRYTDMYKCIDYYLFYIWYLKKMHVKCIYIPMHFCIERNTIAYGIVSSFICSISLATLYFLSRVTNNR